MPKKEGKLIQTNLIAKKRTGDSIGLFYQVDAFSSEPFLGNPTAIVLDMKSEYSTELRESIAREMNLSITAFVSDSEKADFKIEYFSPKKEVPLSGHATIAAVWLLADVGEIESENTKETIKVETKEGIFKTEIQWKNDVLDKVYMTLKKPQFRDVELNINSLADILGIRTDKIESDEKLPLVIADTGSPKLLILISSKEMTDALVPKYDEVERLCRRMKVTGIHLYTFDTYLAGSTCYTRQFEPIRGSPETVASGLANSALGAYLVKRGFAQPGTLIFEQGESLDRPSTLEVDIKGTEDEIKSVRIGGKAKVIFKFEPRKDLFKT
jgi:trans-2,3-dihydro-3-hydroxyanthranilate isomerase